MTRTVSPRWQRRRNRVLLRLVAELVMWLTPQVRARVHVGISIAAGRTPADWQLAAAGFDRAALGAQVLGEEVVP